MTYVPARALARLTLAVAGLAAAATCAHAQQQSYGEIGLSDESVQLRYLRPETDAPVGNEEGELGFGLFLNEARDIVATGHYYFEADRLRFNKLSFKLGPVAYAALLNEQNTDVFSIAIGAEIRFRFLERQELDIVGRAAYAPDVLTFGSADKLWDVTGRVEIPLTDRVIGFGGYRLLEIDLLGGREELEESLIAGVRYRF